MGIRRRARRHDGWRRVGRPGGEHPRPPHPVPISTSVSPRHSVLRRARTCRLWFTERSYGNKIEAGITTCRGRPPSFHPPPHVRQLPGRYRGAVRTWNVWFTELSGNRIPGRITSAVSRSASSRSRRQAAPPVRHRRRPRRQPLGRPEVRHQQDQRTDHDRRGHHRVPADGRQLAIGIAAGPDGNLWFTEFAGNKIGRITTRRVVTEFPIPTAGSRPSASRRGRTATSGSPRSAATGSGGSRRPGRHRVPDPAVPTAARSASRRARTATSGSPRAAPTGRADHDAPAPSPSSPLPTAGAYPYGITAGPDGNLWFTESSGNRSDGSRRRGTSPSSRSRRPAAPVGITSGPDGNLWFTEYAGNKIGRITTPASSPSSRSRRPAADPFGITAGPDGNLWFTEISATRSARITPAGVVTEFPIPTARAPRGITAGPDGNLWFAEFSGDKIGANRDRWERDVYGPRGRVGDD